MHAAYRSGTKLRTVEQREDEQKWERVIPKEEAGYSTLAQSAGSDDKRPDKQQGRAKPKHETASSAGSNDSRLVLPRGSVAAMATCSVGVQTEDSVNESLSSWDWLTSATVTSTATQTLDDGRSLHQWRSIQEQHWLELQKVQHSIWSALNKRRDSGRSSASHSHSPTAMMEQMQERLQSIAQARARKAAPKKRRRARRNGVSRVGQSCGGTIEESIFSTDEVAPQRKRAWVYKEAPPSSTPRITFNTSCHLNVTISHSNNSTSHRTIFHKCGTSCAFACLAVHPNATHRRINEAGDSVPSSQDSVTKAVQNLCISDSPAASAALPAPPPPTMGNSRRQPRPKQQPREYLRCAQCGPVADAHLASTDGGLMQHMGQKHGGQTLLEDTVGQLRWLNRQACVHCSTIWSQRCRRCKSCGFDTPLRELHVGDTFQDRRQPGHQDAAAGGTAGSQQLPQGSQPVSSGELLDDSPSRTPF